MSRASAGARPQSGFTLLEVVVAVAILGLALAATFEVFTTGFRQSRVSGDRAAALIHAESLLAALDAEGLPEPGASEGRIDDRYRWRMFVTPLDPPAEDANPRVGVYRVEVVVSWGDEDRPRSVHLATLRLGPAGAR